MDSRHPESEAPPRIASINELDDELSTIPAPQAPERDRYWCQECDQELDTDLGQTTLCLTCQTRNTERPPMSDSQKLDLVLAALKDLADGQFEVRKAVAVLQHDFKRLNAEHAYNHPPEAVALEVVRG